MKTPSLDNINGKFYKIFKKKKQYQFYTNSQVLEYDIKKREASCTYKKGIRGEIVALFEES